jgi:hypothetical protein
MIALILYLIFTSFVCIIYFDILISHKVLIYYVPINMGHFISLFLFSFLIIILTIKIIRLVFFNKEKSWKQKVQLFSYILISPILGMGRLIYVTYNNCNSTNSILVYPFLELFIKNNNLNNINTLQFGDINVNSPVILGENMIEPSNLANVSNNFLGLSATQWVVVGTIVIVTVGLGVCAYWYWTTASVVTVVTPTIVENTSSVVETVAPVVVEKSAEIVETTAQMSLPAKIATVAVAKAVSSGSSTVETPLLPIPKPTRALKLLTDPQKQMERIERLCKTDKPLFSQLYKLIFRTKVGDVLRPDEVDILVQMCLKFKLVDPRNKSMIELIDAVFTVVENLPLGI